MDVHTSKSQYLKTVPGNHHRRLTGLILYRFLCHLGRVPLVGPVWERPLAGPLGSIGGWSCSWNRRGLQADPANSDAICQSLWCAHLPLRQHSRLQEVSHHGASGTGRYDVAMTPPILRLTFQNCGPAWHSFRLYQHLEHFLSLHHFCLLSFPRLRFDDVRGAEAPGGLAISSQQVLGSLHVVRQPGSEGSDRGSHQQRRGTHGHSHCRSSRESVCRPEHLHFVAILPLRPFF